MAPTVALGAPKEQANASAQAPVRTPDQAAVVENFTQYRSAILRRDGEAAVSYIDSATRDWYALAVKDALTAGRKEFHELDLMRKLMVVRLRQQFSASELRQFDGTKAFVTGVERGLIDSGNASEEALADIRIKGEDAEASTEEHPGRYSLRWRKEQGEWKFSFVAMLTALNMVLERQLVVRRMSQEDYVLAILNAAGNQPLSKDLLLGPRQ
jgi:hypothetical protein